MHSERGLVSERALLVHCRNCSQSGPGSPRRISHISCFVWFKQHKEVPVEELWCEPQSAPTTGLCDSTLVTFSIQELNCFHIYTIHLLFVATVKEATSCIIIQDYLVTMVTCMHISIQVWGFSLRHQTAQTGLKQMCVLLVF